MSTSRFCALVGCRLPLQQAAMARVTTPALAAAVSEAGGLGMLALSRHALPLVAAQLDTAAALTSRPVGVTMIAKFLDDATFDLVTSRSPVVELFWGWPDPALVRAGIVTGWQVGSVEEARAAEDAGCGYVVAQGIEAGGHVRGTIPMLELLDQARAAVGVPVLAAGGIATAADVQAALARGADGVRVGTRFLEAAEADVHPDYLAALVAATAVDTVVTETFSVGWPDAPHRVLASASAAALADGPDPVGVMVLADGTRSELRRRSTSPPTTSTSGQIEAMALYAGTGVDAVTGRRPAAEIVAALCSALDSAHG